jgi:hypothetical protein
MAVRLSTPAPPPATPLPRRSSVRSLVVLILIVFGLGLGAGYALWHHTYPREYVYTGTVADICGGVKAASLLTSPNCFSLTPDAGTAHADGYYSGGGQVSFGGVPTDGGDLQNLRVGAHVQVTVVSALNSGSAVVSVSSVPAP